MAMSPALAVGGGGLGCFIVTLIVVLSMSFDKVDQSEWGLKYFWWSETVDQDPIVEPGLVMVGLGNYLIRFPNTNKYVYFRDFKTNMKRNEEDMYLPPIEVRTNDGLAIKLELEFVYRLQQQKLYDLYLLVGGTASEDAADYKNVLVLTALGVLDTYATTFSAKDFYSNRELVATTFEKQLTETLKNKLFIDVISFQLQPALFPDAFAASIIKTQEQKQDIQVAVQERQTKIIQKKSLLKNSQELAKKLTIYAEAEAEKTKLDAEAKAAQYVYRQKVIAEGFGKILAHFTSGGVGAAGASQFLQYLQLEALKAHNVSQKMVKLGSVAPGGKINQR